MDIDFNKAGEVITALIIDYGLRVVFAVIILFVGWRVIKLITNQLSKILKKREIDDTVRIFLGDLTSWMLKAMLLISIAQMFGIATTSFVAVLGAMGLAIGLALQGTLGNFAGGVLLLTFKPYKVGDVVEIMGHTGTVKKIELFTTVIGGFDGKTHICPNGAVMNSDITNISSQGILRAEVKVGISYSANIKRAKEVLTNIITSDERILQDPAPFVGVVELGDSSVNLVVRGWCDAGIKFGVETDLIEKCKIALDEANIEIPFPQMDLHVSK